MSQIVPSLNSGLKRFAGRLNKEAAKHLCKRTMFGARKEDVDFFTGQRIKKAVKQMLTTTEAAPAPPLNYYNDTNYTDLEIAAGQTWITSLKYDGMNNGRRTSSMKAWWTGQMLNQQKTLREKMVLFWHNHFSTETRTVNNALLFYNHNVLLRQQALGNFKFLVKSITTDPNMLRYLNGAANTKKAPDENYGREMQELFTVGKGAGSHYTEDDVKAAAHVLTGYYVDNKTYTGKFDPKKHDDGSKMFSSFYKNRTIQGRTGMDGQNELDDMIEMIFEQEEVAKFICRKLYRFFIYHTIDDVTEQTIIAPLASVFRKNNYEIKPVLKTLFESQHFFDAANRAVLIKSPVDFTVGACRELNIKFPPATDYVNQYKFWLTIQQQAANMQQNIGDPPNVAGWPAYYQQPQFDKSWINSDTLPKRNIFTDKLVSAGFSKQQEKIMLDPVAFAGATSDPSNPDTLISESIQMLLMLDLSDKEKATLKSGILLSGLQGMKSDHYWTEAWNNLTAKPDDAANKNNVTKKLAALYKYLMDLPQYQLC